jgi:hypothetical protein
VAVAERAGPRPRSPVSAGGMRGPERGASAPRAATGTIRTATDGAAGQTSLIVTLGAAASAISGCPPS